MTSLTVTERRGPQWWPVLPIFGLAVLFNYLWELAQSPLYAGMGEFRTMWWHCFVASLGDGLLVLLIFAVGWLVFRRRDWFVHPGIHGYLIMLVVGLAIGISMEWVAVHVVKWWKYKTSMPLVPGLGIGLTSVAQMLILPPLIFRIAAIRKLRS